MRHEFGHDPAGVLQTQGRVGPEGLLFQRAMPTFQFAVGLRVMGAGEDMAGLLQSDELFEFLATNWGPLSRMMRGRTVGHCSRAFCSTLTGGEEITEGEGVWRVVPKMYRWGSKMNSFWGGTFV